MPGFEAPVNLAYSARNRSAAVRIPMFSASPKAKRIEFRPPDPSCNPYITFAALLMAGLDGIQNRIDPGAPLDKDIYDLPPEELANVPSLPGSLEGALDALENDHEFLLKGDVFSSAMIERWIKFKRENEVNNLGFVRRWNFQCITTFDLMIKTDMRGLLCSSFFVLQYSYKIVGWAKLSAFRKLGYYLSVMNKVKRSGKYIRDVWNNM